MKLSTTILTGLGATTLLLGASLANAAQDERALEVAPGTATAVGERVARQDEGATPFLETREATAPIVVAGRRDGRSYSR